MTSMQAVFSLLSRSARQGAQPAVWLAAALVAGAAQAQGFDFDSVTRLARERAEKPYRAASDKLPADLAKLNYDQVRDIRWRPDREPHSCRIDQIDRAAEYDLGQVLVTG